MFALEYHEATKHHFDRLARSAGHLDWATQPDPFRRFAGAALRPLPREAARPEEPYESLFEGAATAVPLTDRAVADFLRCSMGLSAWKQYQTSRWPLRVNPSSGNLHPTEAYIVWQGGVHHYAPLEHALEERCRFRPVPSRGSPAIDDEAFVVGLTSIPWREAWKYGERAFRYCQHDVGHAIGALRLSAARLGWSLRPAPACPDEAIAAILGLDRDADYAQAEREVPEYLAVVSTGPGAAPDLAALVSLAREGEWAGTANRLSPGHREWSIIERVGEQTERSDLPRRSALRSSGAKAGRSDLPRRSALRSRGAKAERARDILLRRRSALAFDARSTLPAATFLSMLARLLPGTSPWDAVDWPPQVHLALFVHRVDGLVPGLYAFLRDPAALEVWRAAMRPEFLWEPVEVRLKPDPTNDPPSRHVISGRYGGASPPSRHVISGRYGGAGPPSRHVISGRYGGASPNDLFLLLPLDLTWPAARLSCDQDIAGDGFFSLGMIARFEPALREYGEWFYRRLFWECGLIGQVLYLEAEAAGARATGIGCFYDDPVHELLGLSGCDWQSLYHFSMGVPVEDTRLTTEPGYPWEQA